MLRVNPALFLSAMLENQHRSNWEMAKALIDAGARPVPAQENKEPIPVTGWNKKDYTQKHFEAYPALGVRTGEDGNGLAALDFDDVLAQDFFAKTGVQTLTIGRNGNVRKAFFVISDACGRSEGLAAPPGREKGTIIEILSNGKHGIIPPSVWVDALDHSNRQPVEVINAVPPMALTWAWFLELYIGIRDKCALELGIKLPSEKIPIEQFGKTPEEAPDRPGSLFDADPSITIGDILERNSWRFIGTRNVGGRIVEDWQRPGKEPHESHSVTIGYHPGFMHTWTSSTVFEPGRAYRKHQVLAFLEYGGDFKAMATDLAAKGYKKLASVTNIEEAKEPARKPYPIHAFPEKVRDVVEELLKDSNYPPALVGSVAIAVVSTAFQGCATVKAPSHHNAIPISVWIMLILGTGTGKSEVTRILMEPVYDWLSEWFIKNPNIKKELQSLLEVKEAKLSRLKQLHRNERKKEEAEDLLDQIQKAAAEPDVKVRIPRAPYSSFSLEALLSNLANVYPAAMALDADGGSFLGGNSTTKEKLLRLFSILNDLFSGSANSDETLGRGATLVQDAVITVLLMTQSVTLNRFYEMGGDIAKENGFMQRFLFACPPDVGLYNRLESEADAEIDREKLRAFGDIIKHGLTISDRFDPQTLAQIKVRLKFDEDAARLWVDETNHLRLLTKPGSRYERIDTYIARAGEIIARLSACFHCVSTPVGSEVDPTIGEDSVRSAADIVRWHMEEVLRHSEKESLTEDETAVEQLATWLRSSSERLPNGATRREIKRGMRIFDKNPAKLEFALLTLRESGIIAVRPGKSEKYAIKAAS